MFVIRILAVLTLTALQACGDCVSLGLFGFQVTVRDAATLRAPRSPVIATITEGSYEEKLQIAFPQDSSGLLGAFEREGRYQLRIEVPGYQTVVRNGLHVRRKGRCDELQSIRLTINLVPTP